MSLKAYTETAKNHKTYIIDATLREGAQAPGVKFNVPQSVEIAQSLRAIGVDMIEVGHPYASALEFDRVRAVVEEIGGAFVLAHARAKHSDIEAVQKAGAHWVGIFVGVNPLSREVKFKGRSVDEILAMAGEAIEYAHSLNLKVRFTIEDASRTDMDLLVKAYQVALDHGAERLCYSDSVGIAEPDLLFQVIQHLHATLSFKDLEIHCHNDRGLAVANTLAAFDAGANWVSSSVNGIGERVGITDTVTIMANLHFKYQHSLKNPELLQLVSQLVKAITRGKLENQQPIVGRHAFTHTSKLHQQFVERNHKAYEWIAPEIFNRSHELSQKMLPSDPASWITKPPIISATELKYHRHGPGQRHVMIDDRFVQDCRCYCIVRTVEDVSQEVSHVDSHRHHVDSLFLFLGNEDQMTGLKVKVFLDDQEFEVESPVSIFIPAGVEHTYKFISGSGLFINNVFSDNYNESLLEPILEFKWSFKPETP